ncbi:MAG: ATP-binding protein [Elusimicrobiota bacterium]
MNPFNYGGIATGKHFVDRENELKKLKSLMLSGGKALLISPRRYGKTSLAFKLKDTAAKDKDTVVIYIDIIACTSLREFINKYSEALGKALENTVDKIIGILKAVIPPLRPQIQVGPDGEFSLQLITQTTSEDEDRIFEKVIDLPEQLAIKKRKKIIVIFDEFQAINDIDTDKSHQKLLWKIRSIIQNHKHTGYIFAGSQKHLLENMAVPRSSPFFRMLEIVRLDKIPEAMYGKYIKEIFYKAGINVSNEIIETILKEAENIPYYVLNLCHEIYENAEGNIKAITPVYIKHCVVSLTEKNNPYYENEWSKFSTIQKNVLKAIAAGYRNNLFSIEATKRFNLSSIGGTQKALKCLLESQYLTKEANMYLFDDIWFKEWIKEAGNRNVK